MTLHSPGHSLLFVLFWTFYWKLFQQPGEFFIFALWKSGIIVFKTGTDSLMPLPILLRII